MRGLLARMFAKATHAIAVLDVPEERRQWMLHALAEIGANAIQMEQPKFGDAQDRRLQCVRACLRTSSRRNLLCPRGIAPLN